MSPPTTTPRLARLDPVKFAADTVSEVDARARELGLRIAFPGTLTSDLETLVRYAQGELAMTPTEVRAVSRRASGPVYLGSEEYLAEPDAMTDDWRGRVDIVFRAVACRNRMTEGRDIVPGDLAALASMSAAGIRRAMRTGDIVAEHGVIPAEEARRWLTARASTNRP